MEKQDKVPEKNELLYGQIYPFLHNQQGISTEYHQYYAKTDTFGNLRKG
jgi:hypothetical protein